MSLFHWAIGCLALASSVLGETCSKNACYSAVSSHHVTFRRDPRDGCVQFFASTSTPQPVTHTVTQTKLPTTTTKTVTTINTTPTTIQVVDHTTALSVSSTTTTLVIKTVRPSTPARNAEELEDFQVKLADGGPSGTCPAPSPVPSTIPAYASAACSNTAAYSSACGCFGLTTVSTRVLTTCTTTSYTVKQSMKTVRTTKVLVSPASTVSNTYTTMVESDTTTTTATATSYSYSRSSQAVPGGPTPCMNQGLQFAVYPNPFQNDSNNYAAFDPTYFKTALPECAGRTGALGLTPQQIQAGNFTIYRQCSVDVHNFTLNSRGYIYVPQSGTYTVDQIQRADNIIFMWFGSKAYSGWTRENADYTAAFLSNLGNQFSITLVGPAYVPFRAIFGQDGGGYGYDISLSRPDGSVLLEPGTLGSRYVVQYSCDQTTAPPYPPFGQET